CSWAAKHMRARSDAPGFVCIRTRVSSNFSGFNLVWPYHARPMTDLLLKLLGVPANDAVHIAKASLAFRGGLGTGLWLLLVCAAAALVIWMYKASPVTLPKWRRYTLAALRVLFMALLLALLL